MSREGADGTAEARIPTVDLRAWTDGTADERAAIARSVDEALGRAGFLLLTGHGATERERAEVRAAARGFFALPEAVKQRYAVAVGGRGWLGPGAEANGYAEGTETPPDLKESWTVGADRPTGDKEVDDYWFRPNVWPTAEAPRLQALVETHMARMRTVADETLRLLAAALGQPGDFFTRHTGAPTYTCNINWYPSAGTLGEPLPGQYRIGPHTDFGTVTLLDRQQGRGGLQIWTEEQGWADAPWDPAALTVNIGDLMARWTGDRWRSGRHRVLPPSPEAPDEELMSLVYFYECDPHTRVSPLPAPIGRVAHPPVDSTAYLRAKLDAITVG
ncbi:isopenicillin N synthase family dioxygenase [Kitasatospora arboriphila]|uniref:2-oxoglutarate and iron-dependent oxygenase domain-containing protein n=1 Tax=Kitasatospora arboriphila TaxID=258052 RepID=A0ABN1TFJ8_9ACTN